MNPDHAEAREGFESPGRISTAAGLRTDLPMPFNG